MTVPTEYNKPQLSTQVHALLQSTYPRHQAWKAVAALSQGERDVLEMARDLLGWVSITSLAYMYWPVYPDRKLWQRAVERCRRHKPKYKTHPIQYLLLTIATVKAWWHKAAFSGKEALGTNRIVYPISTKSNLYRIVQRAGVINVQGLDLERYYRLESPHERQEYRCGKYQPSQVVEATA